VTDAPYREAAPRPAAPPDAYKVAWARARKRYLIAAAVALSGLIGAGAVMATHPLLAFALLLVFPTSMGLTRLFPCPRCGQYQWEIVRSAGPMRRAIKLRCAKCGLVFGAAKEEA
jgi:hypothetical protein